MFDGPGPESPIITYIDSVYGAQSPPLTNYQGAPVNVPPLVVSSGREIFITLSTTDGSLGVFTGKYEQGNLEYNYLYSILSILIF